MTFRARIRSFRRVLFAFAIGMGCYLPLAAAAAGKNIEQTAANRICVVLIGFVVFSLGLEVGIEKLEEYYEEQNREGMVEVIGKIKEEFLLVGVLSLMLMLLEDTLFAICYQKPTAAWTPTTYCPDVYASSYAGSASSSNSSSSGRMLLAAAAAESTCAGTYESYGPYVEVNALHQLHLLVFWLAVGHVISTFVSYFVARFTVSRWAAWEDELIQGLENHDDHIVWQPHVKAGTRSTSPIPRHLIGWRRCCCGMDGHTLLSLRRFYISRHNLSPKFKIFHMVLEDLEHDFGDFAGIRFWMWLFLSLQIFINSSTWRVVGYANWSNMFFALLLGAHLRSVAEDLSNQIWKHIKQGKENNTDISSGGQDTKVKVFKDEVDQINSHFEDHLENIEPSFQFSCCCSAKGWFNRPRLLMLWFQLCMWNSSGVMVQGAWYSAMGLGCYSYVRGPIVIGIQIPIAAVTLFHQGWVVLPLYALLMHCGEHLRAKGRNKDKARAKKKEELHKKHNVRTVSQRFLQTLQKKSAASNGETGKSDSEMVTGKDDGIAEAPDPKGAKAGASATLSGTSSKYVVES